MNVQQDSWNAKRPLDQKLKENTAAAAYHFEYMSLHNQRIALVRLIHTWHQIVFTVVIAQYGLLLNFAFSIHDYNVLLFATIFGISVVIFEFLYTQRLDKGATNLYPRIIALELILDYHFFRSYLRQVNDKTVMNALDTIEKEVQNAKDTAMLWGIVLENLSGVRPSGRGRIFMNFMSVIVIGGFIILTIYFWRKI